MPDPFNSDLEREIDDCLPSLGNRPQIDQISTINARLLSPSHWHNEFLSFGQILLIAIKGQEIL